MTYERETRWISFDEADVLLLLDVLGEGSEIEITFADGTVCGAVVPFLGANGYPRSAAGQYPSMMDLERIAADLVSYGRTIQELGLDGRLRIAMEMNSNLNEKSPIFEWIGLLKRAEEIGLDVGGIGRAEASSPI